MENKKIFFNAYYGSYGQQGIIMIAMFLITSVFLYFAYFAVVNLKFSNILIGLFLAAPIFLLVILGLSTSKSWILKLEKESLGSSFFDVFYIISLFWRTCWIFKIETDNKGITYFGLPKKIYASWHEIISINVRKFIIFRDMAEVKTRNGFFYFPFSMKERGDDYPKIIFVIGMTWMKWQYEDERLDRLITLENCPLYIEIQKHLGNT